VWSDNGLPGYGLSSTKIYDLKLLWWQYARKSSQAIIHAIVELVSDVSETVSVGVQHFRDCLWNIGHQLCVDMADSSRRRIYCKNSTLFKLKKPLKYFNAVENISFTYKFQHFIGFCDCLSKFHTELDAHKLLHNVSHYTLWQLLWRDIPPDGFKLGIVVNSICGLLSLVSVIDVQWNQMRNFMISPLVCVCLCISFTLLEVGHMWTMNPTLQSWSFIAYFTVFRSGYFRPVNDNVDLLPTHTNFTSIFVVSGNSSWETDSRLADQQILWLLWNLRVVKEPIIGPYPEPV
jgi:hypothetical protein